VRRNFLLVAASLALLLVCCGSRASDSTLTLHGRVLDENGLPVANVQVRLEGLGMAGVSILTDDAGYFSVLKLSPGEYTIEMEKVGFFLLRGQSIKLSADATEFVFTLNRVQEVREKVDVAADPNRIDPESTPQSATLTSTEIFYIPVPNSHNLQQTLVALPQIVRDNTDLIHVAGSRDTQALYLLDGFDIGNPVSGAFTVRLIVDTVRSSEVQTGRFGAEYAHPGTAVLRFETPEGDDHWRFNATDFIPGINNQEGFRLGNYYPRFTFSGPIVKEKFWFLQSFDIDHTFGVLRDVPAGFGPNTTQEWGGDSLSRLLWNVTPSDSVHISFLYNNESDTSVGLDALRPQTTTTDNSLNRLFGSVKNQLWVNHTLFEVGFSEDRTYADSNPQGTAPYILLVNGAKGNFYASPEDKGRRHQAIADAIHPGLRWHGSHTISTGGNFSIVELIQAAQRGEIQAQDALGHTVRQTSFAGSPQFDVTNHVAGGFLQDNWVVNSHWVLQAGLRGDWDKFVHSGMVAPSAAVNYLPFANGSGKISVGWGIYNAPLNLSVIGQTFDQSQLDTLFDPATGAVIAGPARSTFQLPAHGLRQPYYDITSAGWQQRFGKNTIASVELLARNGHRELAFETVTPGQIGSVFLLQSTRRDKYRAASISARHTFARGAVLFGSYTRSKANTDQDLDPVLGQLYFAPQQGGPLSWDTPNRFLSWGSIPTHVWDVDFAYFFEYRTGYPFSVVDQQQFLHFAPNSMRFPDYASLNISLEKRFRFGKYLFAVRGTMVNVADRRNPDVVVNNINAVGVLPAYLTFFGGQGRAVTGRLRFLGRL